MARFKAWAGGVALAFATLCAAVPASAQTSASLWSTGGVGGSLTFNGLTFTVTECTLQLNGSATTCAIAAGTGGALANAELVATAVAGGVKLTFDQSGGSPLFSTAANVDNGLTDMTLNLSVTRAPRGVRVTKVALGETSCIHLGSANCTDATPSHYEYLNVGYTFIGEGVSPALVPPYTDPNLISVPTNPTGTTNTFAVDPGNDTTSTTARTDTVTSAAFAPVSSLLVTKDIHFESKSGSTLASTTPGTFLVLANFTQTYFTVPEPLTIGVLASGFLGLLVCRRRRVL